MQLYLTTSLSALTIDTPCAGPRSGAADYFQQVLLDLQSALYVRCQAIRTRGQKSMYGHIAELYNSTLASHFPFSPLESNTLTEAAPQSIADFLQLLEANAGLLSNSAAASQPFLARLSGARPFLAQISGPRQSVDFIAHFRDARDREQAGDQIAEWTLAIGTAGQDLKTYSSRQPQSRASWRIGQPIALTLRWAANAAFVPETRSTQNVTASAAGVTYRFTDAWSLFRFAESYLLPGREQDDSPTTVLLGFTIPETPVAPLARLQPMQIKQARVFLRLELLVPGKPDGLPFPPLPLPDHAPLEAAVTVGARPY